MAGQIGGYITPGPPTVSQLLVSGGINSGVLANNSVLSGNIASGQLDTYHHASGCVVRASQFAAPVASGTAWNLITEELVSGVRAVNISQSGNIRVAMAAVSGRMPAVGLVVDNVQSGIQATIYTHGVVQFTSGMFTGIGYFGQGVWVGRSGQPCPISGSFCSGGFASGDEGQRLGVALALGSGALLLNLNTTVWSGGPLGEATGGTGGLL